MKNSDVLIVPKDRSLYFFPALSEISVCSGKKLLVASNDYLRHYLKTFQLIIFLDYGFEPIMAAKIRPFTKAKIVLFFWNHFKLEHYRKLAASQKETAIDEIYHFDPLEARDLQLKHNSSFYTQSVGEPADQIAYDIFFGASDNGRKQQALALKERFELLGLSTFYHILPKRGNDQAGYLPYTDYLTLVKRSKGILEILRAGQYGVTLRTFESLFLQKKLLTTNKMLPFYRLYDPRNIFMLGPDLSQLTAFLTTPYQPIDQKLRDFFEASHWVQRFVDHQPELFEQFEYYPELMAQKSAL
ncbi:oligosaccharide biosynthesis protein Alg14 [Enterococcus dongliensis]|uniref:oligosaccharide biosynthesis protein Alg14 n=1 Tax=Enterococcus dongliensis TaxID=2559925 RepID=UPI0028910824|nr:oligosaccharide biosynthesis protein Alg14 [Enterococcus dongliensis]MDT2704021.1 oligosaccharide biosynthesis protein Alg14 [Enterococcus dongliensis]